jgi:hypothetical protein
MNLREVRLNIGTPAKSLGPPQYMKSIFDFLRGRRSRKIQVSSFKRVSGW